MRGVRSLAFFLLQQPRILKYRLLSTCRNVAGDPIRVQPLLMEGGGRIAFGSNVRIGWSPSPSLYSGYVFIAALQEQAVVTIADDVSINNNAVLYSLGAGITIGSRTVIGPGVQIYDSDFHHLDPARRAAGAVESRHVDIGVNVFIGAAVTILKGVSIGANSVVGAGSVVSRSCPEGSVIAGNPARVVRSL